MDNSPVASQTEWQLKLANRQAKAAQLFAKTETQQKKLGYFHTLREICQQPSTWLRTCERMIAAREGLQDFLTGIQSMAFTGSGSSQYAGDCVRLPIQNELKINVASISGGDLLIHGGRSLPQGKPGVLVSLARSGNSPESSGAIQRLMDSEPQYRHLILTCNEQGNIAKEWRNHSSVHVITLPPETNDESLVMTSSFTNLVLAARFLGMLDRPGDYREMCEVQSSITQNLLLNYFDLFAKVASKDFQRVVFLGSGTRYAASCEAALKMLEMTSGRVATMSETYLGLRHGPMSFIHDDTLVVAFLSSETVTRAYELDLLNELDRKRLGLGKLIIGENIPASVVRRRDEVLSYEGSMKLHDDDLACLCVVAGQLLAFFRCLETGLQPDSPSESGVINRVVEKFKLHTPS